jgi:hypothetical protein
MTEDAHTQALEKIRQYASECRHLREQEMDVDVSDEPALEARLDQTVRELQERLKKQQSQLEKVGQSVTTKDFLTYRFTSYEHCPVSPCRLRPLRTHASDYHSFEPSKPLMRRWPHRNRIFRHQDRHFQHS